MSPHYLFVIILLYRLKGTHRPRKLQSKFGALTGVTTYTATNCPTEELYFIRMFRQIKRPKFDDELVESISMQTGSRQTPRKRQSNERTIQSPELREVSCRWSPCAP